MSKLNPVAIALLSAFVLSACGKAAVGLAPTVSVVTETPFSPLATDTPPLNETIIPTQQTLPFDADTYQDKSHGFQLKYPASWDKPEFVEQQSRGSIVQVSANGEVKMDIVTLLWDPKGDLEAFLEVRETAFESSGFAVLSKDEIDLGDGWRGVGYKIESTAGDLGYFFFTTIGDQYLQLSGSGDLDLLAEIASTVRPIN